MMQRTSWGWLLLLLLLLTGCDAAPTRAPSVLRLGTVLGGEDTSGYLRAELPRNFSFPADHGPHPGFRNEWWYLTGNLDGAEGRRFGYQLTFFNGALRPPTADRLPSVWDSERVWMAHLALTDVATGEHLALERFARESPGLAGADSRSVWLEDWRLELGDDTQPWRIAALDSASGLGLQLRLRPSKAPVLQGHAGLSQKSPQAGNASYYYSLTRLQTTGSIRMAGQDYQISGQSWLDREWSTSALASDQSGWNWFSLQFNDGQELMYYQLLDDKGAPHPNSAGNWTSITAQQTYIAPAAIELQPLATWKAPDGAVYTTAWELSYDGKHWRVQAVQQQQWMDLSLPYWEGAVDVRDALSGELAGRGYLEMVRQQ